MLGISPKAMRAALSLAAGAVVLALATASAASTSAPTIKSFSPASGAPGAQVTITGKKLDGASSVTFNGTPALWFTVRSSSEIVAAVANGTTSGKVAVTTPGGTAKSSTKFKVVASTVGPPTITSFSPTSAEPGTWVVLTGTNFVDVQSIQIGGVDVALSIFTDTHLEAGIEPDTPSGPITVTTLHGTVTTADSFTVIHPDLPPPRVHLEFDPPTIVANGTDTTTAKVTLRDANGQLLPGENVTLAAAEDSDVQIGATTDHGDGTYTAPVTGSIYAGPIPIDAHDGTLYDEEYLDQTCPTFCAVFSGIYPLRTRPAPGDATVTVSFTDVPDLGSTSKAISLTQGSTPVKGTVTADPLDPTRVIFTPSDYLDHGKTYTIHVGGGNEQAVATDTHKHALFRAVTSTFTIEQKQPEVVENPGGVLDPAPRNMTQLSVLFDETMRPNIVPLVRMTEGAVTNVKIKVTVTGSRLTISWSQRLAKRTSYFIVVPGGWDSAGNPKGLMDAAGNAFPNDLSFILKTGTT